MLIVIALYISLMVVLIAILNIMHIAIVVKNYLGQESLTLFL